MGKRWAWGAMGNYGMGDVRTTWRNVREMSKGGETLGTWGAVGNYEMGDARTIVDPLACFWITSFS